MKMFSCGHTEYLRHVKISSNHMMYECDKCHAIFRDRDRNVNRNPQVLEQIKAGLLKTKTKEKSKCIVKFNEDGSLKC